MKTRPVCELATLGLTALVLLAMPGTSGASWCGNGLVEGAEECDVVGHHEVCSNLIDDDHDGLVDCADPDCRSESGEFVCGNDCKLEPACRELEGSGKIYFLDSDKLDRLWVHMHGTALSAFDVENERISFAFSNLGERFCAETMDGRAFVRREHRKRLKYTRKADGSPMCYRFQIRVQERADAQGAEDDRVRYEFRFKAVDDLAAVNPDEVGTAEGDLARIFLQIVVGDDSFYSERVWHRSRRGWYLIAPGPAPGR